MIVLLLALAVSPCDLYVNEVYDGDSFFSYTVAVLSPSNHRTERTGFRLARVFAPETYEPGGKQATEILRQLIQGQKVRVEVLPNKNLGRYVVEAWLCDPQLNVNDYMRGKGYVSQGIGAK